MLHYVISLLCQIYCEGPLLKAVQESRMFNDSKHFVDMPLVYDPAVTLRDFQQIADKIPENEELLINFVNSHFNPPGQDLEECFPEDWKEVLPKIANIHDERYRFWAEKLHMMWKDLCRQAKVDVYENPELYSLLYVPNRFIVPGGRFREFYYWDSYWIIKGLLYSEMFETARGMIKNFVYMVEHYGFVPNGGRVYYLLRSQPPMLTSMVYEFYKATGDAAFVRQMLPALVNEYKFWTSRRSTQYRESATLFQYKVDMKNPRPESYREDMELVQHLTSSTDKERVWSNIASAAETGWDFSSRWFAHEGVSANRIASVRTWSIVPVDLNAFMCMNSWMLAELFKIKGDQTKSLLYEARYLQAKMLMKQMHWNETDGVWYDYDLEQHRHVDAYYISNALPLFAHCYDDQNETVPLRVYEYMKAIGAFNSTKGIPTSFIQSDQQWDSVNSWPPMVHMIIEGFRTSPSAFLRDFAEQLASQWLRTNFQAFQATDAMYEKYDCTGTAGSGGEYEVQTGFGWTNGVVLDLLKSFGATVHFNETTEPSPLLAPSTKKMVSVVYDLISNVVVGPPEPSIHGRPPSTVDEELIVEIDAEVAEQQQQQQCSPDVAVTSTAAVQRDPVGQPPAAHSTGTVSAPPPGPAPLGAPPPRAARRAEGVAPTPVVLRRAADVLTPRTSCRSRHAFLTPADDRFSPWPVDAKHRWQDAKQLWQDAKLAPPESFRKQTSPIAGR